MPGCQKNEVKFVIVDRPYPEASLLAAYLGNLLTFSPPLKLLHFDILRSPYLHISRHTLEQTVDEQAL